MAVQFGTFIAELAAKAGIAADHHLLKDILSANLQVPDEIAHTINNNLVDVAGAKQHPELKRYFHAQALNGIDATLEALMDELQLDAAARAEVERETSTYKRVPALIRLLREVEEKRATVKSEERAAEQVLDFAIEAEFASRQFANEAAPKKVNILTAKNLLAEDLKSKKIKVVRMDDNTLKLVQADDPETDYLENNKPVSFADYIDKLLGANKLLKVSDPKAGKNPVTTSPIVLPGDTGANHAKVVSAIDQQLEQIRAAG